MNTDPFPPPPFTLLSKRGLFSSKRTIFPRESRKGTRSRKSASDPTSRPCITIFSVSIRCWIFRRALSSQDGFVTVRRIESVTIYRLVCCERLVVFCALDEDTLNNNRRPRRSSFRRRSTGEIMLVYGESLS